MEEAQLAQLIELFLLVDAIVRAAQLLVKLRQRTGELDRVGVAVLRLLAQRGHDDFLEILWNARAQRVNRRWRGVDDLVQHFAQTVGSKRPISREQLVHHGAE